MSAARVSSLRILSCVQAPCTAFAGTSSLNGQDDDESSTAVHRLAAAGAHLQPSDVGSHGGHVQRLLQHGDARPGLHRELVIGMRCDGRVLPPRLCHLSQSSPWISESSAVFACVATPPAVLPAAAIFAASATAATDAATCTECVARLHGGRPPRCPRERSIWVNNHALRAARRDPRAFRHSDRRRRGPSRPHECWRGRDS